MAAGAEAQAADLRLSAAGKVKVVVLAGRRREVERAAEDLRGVKGILEGDYLIAAPRVAGGRTGHRHPHARGGPPSGDAGGTPSSPRRVPRTRPRTPQASSRADG